MAGKELSRREIVAASVAAGAMIPAHRMMSGAILGLKGTGRRATRRRARLASYRSTTDSSCPNPTCSTAPPVTRSEAGQPIENGRTGTLVWTTPDTLRLQVNRVDVYAQNRNTNSFPERNLDYGSGCRFVDIQFRSYGPDVFSSLAFKPHLSGYDGLVTLQEDHVSARAFVCPDHDVVAIEIEDRRQAPDSIDIDLRMLRGGREFHQVRGRVPRETAVSQRPLDRRGLRWQASHR